MTLDDKEMDAKQLFNDIVSISKFPFKISKAINLLTFRNLKIFFKSISFSMNKMEPQQN